MSLPIFNQPYAIDFHMTDFWGFKTTPRAIRRGKLSIMMGGLERSQALWGIACIFKESIWQNMSPWWVASILGPFTELYTPATIKIRTSLSLSFRIKNQG